MAQIYYGHKSSLADIFGVYKKRQIRGDLLDFFQKRGATDILHSDTACVEI
jgi:hypothetical protein